MKVGFFITGTDTGVGKTLVSIALLKRFAGAGYRVAGMKPVASGCVATAQGLRNDDALRLLANASVPLDYATVNPYAFEPPVAPHLAARQCAVSIDGQTIQAAFRSLQRQVDCVIVEGVGGWRVPINPSETMADVAGLLGLPVILVAGIRLGCINHALLTVSAIQQAGMPLAGWVANRLDPDCLLADEIIQSLQQAIGAPLIATVPCLPQAALEGEGLDFEIEMLLERVRPAHGSSG